MVGVPGKGGPPPKREDQRRRRNKPVVPVTKAPAGPMVVPDLEGEHSDLGRRFYESLKQSGQSQFYELSDWVAAEIVVGAIDTWVTKPTAVMLQTIQSGMSLLLATEGDRRRMRLELERNPVDEGSEADAAIASLSDYRSSSSA